MIEFNGNYYQPYTLDLLNEKHTGTLLNWLKVIHHNSSSTNANSFYYYDEKTFRYATKEQLKLVLDIREHVPNKQERRAERQARAKQRN